jgi:hypothetical protein
MMKRTRSKGVAPRGRRRKPQGQTLGDRRLVTAPALEAGEQEVLSGSAARKRWWWELVTRILVPILCFLGRALEWHLRHPN